MKLTIVSDNRVLAEQFHMKSGSYSSCQLFFSIYTAHNHSFVSPLCPVYVGSSPLCLG